MTQTARRSVGRLSRPEIESAAARKSRFSDVTHAVAHAVSSRMAGSTSVMVGIMPARQRSRHMKKRTTIVAPLFERSKLPPGSHERWLIAYGPRPDVTACDEQTARQCDDAAWL